MAGGLNTSLKAVRWGVAAAVLMVALAVASALWNPVTALPHLLVFSAVAVGLRRGKAWSGFGGALFLCASIVGVALSLLLSSQLVVYGTSLLVAAAVYAIPAALLFRAGRALRADPGAASSPVPWIALSAFVALFPLAFNPVAVRAGSMEHTLLTGDQILVLRLRLGAPRRGDLVSFRYPVDRRQSFIKRVIAAGGDRVRFQDGRLLLNGAPISEPYVVHKASLPDSFLTNFPNGVASFSPIPDWPAELARHTRNQELVIPEGKLFVLGDNRDNSLDSRHWGFLDPKDILGRPVVIYYSQDAADRPNATPPLFSPGRIRWNRLFRAL